MATALSYIEAAMSKLGMLSAGEVVSAEDAALGLLRLNALLDQMENENLFGYATLNTSFNLPAATVSRTIGAGQQINIVRPVRLLAGCFSTLDGADYDLQPVTEAEYNGISLKTSSSSFPLVCFYDGGFPTGNVYFWPPVASAVTVTLITPTAKTTAADTTTAIVHPPGYQRYIENALAVEMAPDFGIQPTGQLLATAANAKRSIKRTNARIPQMEIPSIGYMGITVDEFRSGYF